MYLGYFWELTIKINFTKKLFSKSEIEFNNWYHIMVNDNFNVWFGSLKVDQKNWDWFQIQLFNFKKKSNSTLKQKYSHLAFAKRQKKLWGAKDGPHMWCSKFDRFCNICAIGKKVVEWWLGCAKSWKNLPKN